MPLNIMKDQDNIFLVKDDIYLIQRLHRLSVLYDLFIKITFCFVLFVLLIDWRTKCRWTLWKTKTTFALYKDDIYLMQTQHRLSVLQYTLYLKMQIFLKMKYDLRWPLWYYGEVAWLSYLQILWQPWHTSYGQLLSLFLISNE